MMKVLVCDPIAEQGIERLRQESDIEVTVATGLPREELIACVPAYDALIVRSETKVTREVLEAGTNLKAVGRAGVGVDNIDIDAATKRGVVVLNAPEGNTIAAVEHTIAMLMSLARNIPQAHASLKAGKWNRKAFMGVQVDGKTLGVIGLGRIGSEVARRMHALGMHALGFDPFVAPERCTELGIEIVDLPRLFSSADFITVHVPMTKETRHMIGAKEFAQMKDGVRVINCARGGVIDEQALYDAVKSGKVAGAALDVFEQEPLEESPLLELDQVIVTPHLGASTEEAQINVAMHIAEEIIKVLKGDFFKNAVNVPSVPPALLAKLKPFMPLAESLGRLYTELAVGGHGRIEVIYRGLLAEQDVALLTTAVLKGVLDPILQEKLNLVNARFVASERGIRVAEVKERDGDRYPAVIEVRGETDEGIRSVAGCLGENGLSRLVRINDYPLDLVPSGYMLVIDYADRPGVIGRVGTILGRNNINIAYMQVGRKSAGGQAVMVLGIDDPASGDVLAEVARVPEVTRVRPVEWWQAQQ
ncbi:MAG: phosphoglycerate dehydrogenase [Firmicutes bacterium]|nr:phosphoglycerate dehydrogenase [Bacillota bacterium]